MFVLSLAVVLSLFLMKIANLERIMFWIFLGGNTFYYIVGIVLAFVFKDNRCILQISVPGYCVSQANELLFAFACPLR